MQMQSKEAVGTTSDVGIFFVLFINMPAKEIRDKDCVGKSGNKLQLGLIFFRIPD